MPQGANVFTQESLTQQQQQQQQPQPQQAMPQQPGENPTDSHPKRQTNLFISLFHPEPQVQTVDPGVASASGAAAAAAGPLDVSFDDDLPPPPPPLATAQQEQQQQSQQQLPGQQVTEDNYILKNRSGNLLFLLSVDASAATARLLRSLQEKQRVRQHADSAPAAANGRGENETASSSTTI